MKIKTKWAAVVISGMAILNSDAALSAPIASASASFDWSTVAFTTTDTGASINWLANVSPVTPDSTIGDAITGSQISNTYPAFASTAWDTNPSSASEIYSIAQQTRDFAVSCNGTTTCSFDFSLAYNLIVTLEDPSNATSNNLALADVRLGISSVGLDFSAPPFADSSIWLDSSTTSIYDNLSGVLSTYIVDVADGTQFTIWAQATSQATLSTVPLPSAVWFFLSALMGILGLTRRKSALAI